MKRLRLFGSQEAIQIVLKINILSLERVSFFEEFGGKVDAIFLKDQDLITVRQSASTGFHFGRVLRQI